MKFAAVYIRVSTDRQEELSPNAQLRLAKEYAAQNHLSILEDCIFMDIGISGKQADNRPQFQQMIAMAKQKNRPFDVVLLWKFSRFARSQDEAAYYKSILRKKCNVDVISVTEPIMDGMYGRLIEMIIEWNDEFYSYNLSQEVWKGMSEKALQGGNQARPPYGYQIKQKKEPPTIVPAQANVVKLIFQKYALEGKEIFEIAKELNELGLKTARGNAFARRSVQYIIDNPIYCGYVRWNRTENSTHQLKPRSAWIIAKGSHEPIISEQLFEQAAKRRKKESLPQRRRPSSTYKHWLSGLLVCPACKRTMICSRTAPRPNGKRYCNFVCSGYSKEKCKERGQISAKRAETAVLQAFSKICSQSSVYYMKTDNANKQLNLSICRQQLQQIEKKLFKIKEAFEAGIDTLEEYQQEKMRLLSEKDILTNKLYDYEEQNERPLTADNADLVDPYQIFSSNRLDDAVKNQALKRIVEKIIYRRKSNCLEIYFYL